MSSPASAPAKEIAVGDVVLVYKKYKAVVRYIGKTNFKDGIWYGVELEREKGKHNGTVYNHTYFVAKPGHGTFVAKEDLSPFDAKELAVKQVRGFVLSAGATR